MRGREKHAIDSGMSVRRIPDEELLTLEVLLHYESTLGQLSKQHFVRAPINVLVHMAPTLVPEAYALATAQEVTADATVGVGADAGPLDQVGEDIYVVLQLVEPVIILAVVLYLGKHGGVYHVVFEKLPELVGVDFSNGFWLAPH